MAKAAYAPDTFRALTYFDAVPRFLDGADTPRAYLERCLAVISDREPVVKAWVCLNEAGARQVADEATVRYRAGRPLSAIDGMPIGIKDLIETRDMPTQMGCAAYEGNFTGRDSSSVRALRDAGAIILGKTVTTELGLSHPGPTTNPFDPKRTPGGSSSGSAAAIGAGMVPVTIGSQVGGSIVRPASFCANHAFKPTLGAISRGDRLALSQAVVGTHAGSIEDMWQVAVEIAKRAGGDPGYPGLYGPGEPPPAMKPSRLIVMETEGWSLLDQRSLDAFEALLGNIRRTGVEILRRGDSALIERFEASVADAKAISNDLNAYESSFNTLSLTERFPGRLSERILDRMRTGQTLGIDQYRARLQQRDEMRNRHRAIAPMADGVIALSSPGPAPIWEGDIPGTPLVRTPTGDYAFNAATSALGAPSVTVPWLAVSGLPVGVQIVGQQHEDARIAAIARWLTLHIGTVSRE